MSSSRAGQGKGSPLSSASNPNGKKKKKSHDTSDDINNSIFSNTSIDLDVSFDKPAGSLKELQQMFINKLNLIQAETQSKVDTLFNVVKMKDEIIGKLQADIGKLQADVGALLKVSVSYMTKETSDHQKMIDDCNKAMESKFSDTEKYMQDIKNKTVDLEDRSRRSNLVFFNFPEARNGETENCEQMIHELLKKVDILQDEDVWIDRAHRLGRKQPESNKMRPIIVKFSYYKHKEFIIQNASKFRNSPINVSEDFSKETLQIHKQLIGFGKHAKSSYDDPVKSLVHYKLNYRRLVVTYSLNKRDPNAKKVTKTFSLGDILNNACWFDFKSRDPVRQAHGVGYQPGNE